ncbi:TonB-dependent receptor [Pontibacter sp. KCTC 32443]|uniref:TonB-dependent receptor n=1 Tax=Pontibacter TaxID=323449 RepID=UPI00164E5487|nr:MULTISPECIES: TonB-dependent receptor [Pontibacter]MBC5772483.1 TonB-dependent receptor [Pontibacter sp. KCTC 32443]
MPQSIYRYFLLLLFSFSASIAFAQSYRVSGIVRSATDKQALIGATVAVPQLRIGTITDARGSYSLNLPAGTHELQATYVGYMPVTQTITVTNTDRTIDIALQPSDNQLQEVVVEANTLEQKLTDNRMSVEQLTTREAKLLPAIFGEVDLIKTLQLKPGVQSGGEGSSGLYVRGGGPDQNLVLLDDAVIYNPSHLFGFFSVFNPDAVRNVELYKGGFPAQFGGRLSSVLDVRMNEGNNDKLRVNGGIGLISSRLSLDGPIVKDKLTFLVSGRRTYVDSFTRIINKLNEDNKDYNPIPDYYFYDFNARLNYNPTPKDEITLSSYFGRDFFTFDDADFSFSFNWGNTMGSLNWRHNYNTRLFSNTSFSLTGYKYSIQNKIDVFSFNLGSEVKDISLKTDYEWLLDDKHTIRFGASATNHAFTVGRLNFDSDDDRLSFSAGNNYKASEFGAYISDDYNVNAQLSLNYGLRVSGFNSQDKTYAALEPRAAARYSITTNTSVKASYASMMQYIHLLANSGASLPTDIWFPSTARVKPQRSQQVAAGVSHLFGDGKYLVTNEVYYKWMHRQIDFRDGANLFVNDSLENEFLFGKGESYGNEIYLEKIKGRTTGWIGYTLSWTYRQFDEINDGRRFPTRYDRRHDLSVVVLHQLNKRLSLTGAFVYGTGNAFSLPVARFAFQDVEGQEPSVVPIYSDRNSFRLDATHRLDVGVVWKLKPKRGEADLTFNAYNAYNRRNPYFVYFEQLKDEEDEQTIGFRAKQVSLFPVIPSVTYNFRF